ncbi:LCP family protein [Streptomyces sp. ISL-11]|uniref:LCP family protein n=1 Tax=Streptomyces sp. ISL-11 TaxID=2819174 RepID=UPI001BE86260|nr:LCP family protein [Streptomyces sp. ISL-11]MBT2386292.1 LytR C-terminal domain-containing protein [Streptomyces sp. ISL-11]
MNDRQDAYAQDPYGQQPQVYGYDAYGQPVYRPDAPERVYDQYGQPVQQQAAPQPVQQQPLQQQDYGYPGNGGGYDPYAAQQYERQQPAAPQQRTQQQEWIPRQSGPPAHEDARSGPEEPRTGPEEPGQGESAPEYRTEQFSFIEEPDEDSEDVIDWLKFSESRTERRDERKRKGRNRVVALVVVLVLAVAGVAGYLWFTGSRDDKGPAAAGGAQKRDVIVVHLRAVKGGDSSTALLVDNETTKKGTTVLLPNALAVPREGGGSTTLGKSVQDDGTGATRDALNNLLGAEIKGSWRLDTPYLENLVELVGGIAVDTDTDIPGEKPGDRPLVRKGTAQNLGGRMAVAYATHHAPGEAPDKQLSRFGQVMQAVLKKLSGETGPATRTVETLAQIPDPSLSVEQLGASLAQLAVLAKKGSYDTAVLPVRTDGTLGDQATDKVVKEVLGGTVKSTDKNAAPRVSVKNATGNKGATGSALVTLVNGGYTVVDGGSAGPAEAASAVTYADDARAAEAKEVAKTLGLPAGAVKKAKGAGNADVTVVLGKDYKS